MRRIIKHLLSFVGLNPTKYIDVCFDRDASIFTANSGLQGDTLPVVDAKMRIICHTIEKALSLPDCRPDFGKEKILNLISLYHTYEKLGGGKDKNVINLVKSTLYIYVRHREEHGLECKFLSPEFKINDSSDIECGATPLKSSQEDFIAFPHIAYSRHSVRNYSDRPVESADIIKAVKLAQTSPSACNRQATRVYAITDSAKIELIKQRHGGIRAFGKPAVIFVITQDINLYLNEYERNTWLVDGGIFCMNLLYSLNSVGIVNCPVIWGGMDDEDKFLSEIAGIPDNERTVLLVVGGYAPENGVKTPCSSKRPVETILRIVSK